MNFWMIFQVFGIVSNWSVKALADGKITIIEAGELAEQIGGLLGIPTDITVPTATAPEIVAATDTGEEEPDDANPRAPPPEDKSPPV